MRPHVFACPCGCEVPIPGPPGRPAHHPKGHLMSVQSTGSGFVATCDCGWRTSSQTRRVVEQRLREHEEGCK